VITVWAGRSDQGRGVVCVCWRKSETWALSAKLLFPRGLAAGGVTFWSRRGRSRQQQAGADVSIYVAKRSEV
jgi:hypothetical protein